MRNTNTAKTVVGIILLLLAMTLWITPTVIAIKIADQNKQLCSQIETLSNRVNNIEVSPVVEMPENNTVIKIITSDTEIEVEQVATDLTPLEVERACWDFLIEQGFNEYVTAGILGNIEAECSFDPCALSYDDYYWGICQWNKGGYPEIYGNTSLESQLEFLMDTIEYEMDTYGMGYENFCALENEQDAAIAFAKGYERCASSTYGYRANYATACLEEMRVWDEIHN